MKIFDPFNLINESSCFDLQFRKDTRKERTNAPVYYRWKAQFVVTAPKDGMDALKEIQKSITCGSISIAGNQARLSVQKIDDLTHHVIPFLRKSNIAGDKKKEFELWQKAVAILLRNKGIHLAAWKRNDLLQLIEIHKTCAKYKTKTKEHKWMDMAKTVASRLGS